MKSILLVKKFLGLVEMTSGLVNASFNLPEWQAVKMIFFAPRFCKASWLFLKGSISFSFWYLVGVKMNFFHAHKARLNFFI